MHPSEIVTLKTFLDTGEVTPIPYKDANISAVSIPCRANSWTGTLALIVDQRRDATFFYAGSAAEQIHDNIDKERPPFWGLVPSMVMATRLDNPTKQVAIVFDDDDNLFERKGESGELFTIVSEVLDYPDITFVRAYLRLLTKLAHGNDTLTQARSVCARIASGQMRLVAYRKDKFRELDAQESKAYESGEKKTGSGWNLLPIEQGLYLPGNAIFYDMGAYYCTEFAPMNPSMCYGYTTTKEVHKWKDVTDVLNTRFSRAKKRCGPLLIESVPKQSVEESDIRTSQIEMSSTFRIDGDISFDTRFGHVYAKYGVVSGRGFKSFKAPSYARIKVVEHEVVDYN